MKRVKESFAPLAAMLMALFVTAFLDGIYATENEIFPYPQVRDAVRTFKALLATRQDERPAYFSQRVEAAAVPAAGAPAARWTDLDGAAPRLPVIVNGGLHQFLDLCPDPGCLAVAFDRRRVTAVWPYRPDDIFAADITADAYPHELLGFKPRRDVYPVGVQRYPNGDLLVNFQAQGEIFPFGMGIARIRADGSPRWTRFDYSHHWSKLGADGIAHVPGNRIGESDLSFSQGVQPSPVTHLLDCKTNRPQLDTVQRVDGDGRLLDEIELVPVLVQSNWSGLLPETTDPCDPLHLNYIDIVGEDADAGLVAGDLVLSLRNLSRFIILDPSTRKIRRVVSGSFVQQHSVHHLSGPRFLLFDNRGGDHFGPASRILELDLATGRERRVFPSSQTPDEYARLFSDTAGYLDISLDRKRVLASFSHAGRAFEIDIASGRLLAVYDNLHDVSSVSDVPEHERRFAGRFPILGMSYLLD